MADQGIWTAVDQYITESQVPYDPVLDAALEASAAASLPPHDVAPNQGKLLYLLAGLGGVRRILEIGTLGAYNTIWLARSLPEGGRVVTLEADPKHASGTRANLDRAGLSLEASLTHPVLVFSFAREGFVRLWLQPAPSSA